MFFLFLPILQKNMDHFSKPNIIEQTVLEFDDGDLDDDNDGKLDENEGCESITSANFVNETPATGSGIFTVIRLKDGAIIFEDANVTLEFDQLDPGEYRIIYTYDADDASPTAAHVGCTQSISKTFNIKNVDCGSFRWDGN